MGRYEYRYRVSVGDEERNGRRRRKYKLEVRTNFILKPMDDSETVLATETFSDRLPVADDENFIRTWGPRAAFYASGKQKVDNSLRSRLGSYGMPDAQIRALVQTTFDLVQDPSVFHVLVSVDVLTVQSEGETLDSAVDRAVVPDTLTPLQLRWTNVMKKSKALDDDLFMYLMELPVVRVREDDVDEIGEDEVETCLICIEGRSASEAGVVEPDKYVYHEKHSVGRKEGLHLMEECRICLKETIVGAKIASLPCKHSFHHHCIFRRLLKTQSCPVCHVEIEYKPKPKKQIPKMLDSLHIN